MEYSFKTKTVRTIVLEEEEQALLRNLMRFYENFGLGYDDLWNSLHSLAVDGHITLESD